MLIYTNTPYFQQLLQSIPIGMVIYNTEGRMYAVNRAALEIFGLSEEVAMGMSWEPLFTGAERTSELEAFFRAMAEERHADPVQIRFRCREGRCFHLGLSMSLLAEYDKVFGILLVVNDNTELIESHERELAAVEESAKKLNNLSMAVAHQIRNPLLVIGGFSKLVRKKIDARSGALEYLDGIDESAQRLDAVVEAVSTLTGVHVDSVDRVTFRELIDRCQECWAEGRDGDGPAVSWAINVSDVPVVVDAGLLLKALREIWDNCCDFAAADRVRIKVYGTVENGRGFLTISDDGPGIGNDILGFVFDPFFTTKAVGVGMGLCVAERAVHLLGGHIEVVSDDAPGARLSIHIPVGGQSVWPLPLSPYQNDQQDN